jgi:choline dehydrogenase-like flavoprotein
MLIDDSTLYDTPLRARFCVVGSGMGGAAVATTLAARGEDVLLLEAGGLEREADSDIIRAEHVGRAFNIPVSRCIELGGTSNQWHGICAPLDEIDFEPRSWVPHSGWPIRKSDLSQFYTDASAVLDIEDAAKYEDSINDGELRDRLRDLEFNAGVLENKLVQFRKPPLRWKDRLRQLAYGGTLRLVLGALALEIVPSDDGRRADRLIIGRGGRTCEVRADVYVICAGGLETPRLLLNSRRAHPNGLGNAFDLVGRFLLDHPVGHFCKIKFRRPTNAPLYASLSTGPHRGAIAGLMVAPAKQREWRLANHYLWIRPSVSAARVDDDLLMSFLAVRSARDLTPKQMWAIATNRDILYRILVHRFGLHPTYRFGDLFFMTEQAPNPESRVSLSDRLKDKYGYPVARVDWRLSQEDLDGFHRYTRALFQFGLRSPQYSLARMDEPSIWERTVASAAHHLGTVRMADSPERGVVDANLRVFGIDNLYVCDASVFATAGSVNPSLTITALALRLAAHLVN